MTVGTAHGKVILLGEHAVVYGRPALAAAIAPGAEAAFEPGVGSGLVLEVPAWNFAVRSDDDSELGRALKALLAAMGRGGVLPEGTIRATVNLPPGGGLGSSASLGVAVARALGADDHTVLDAVHAWESVFHGTPSGVDHTLAARGGVGVFSKTESFQPISLREPLALVIGDTGERSRTRTMVESVRRMHERRPAATEQTMDAIAALVRNGALSLAAGDLRGLGQLMDMNQALLASLFVSTERTEALCAAARAAGALGAKLTGGGGGGCVIAVAPGHETAVLTAWRGLGAEAFVGTIEAMPAVHPQTSKST